MDLAEPPPAVRDALIDAAADVLFVVDEEGVVHSAAVDLQALEDLDRTEIEGVPVFELVAESDRDALRRRIERALGSADADARESGAAGADASGPGASGADAGGTGAAGADAGGPGAAGADVGESGPVGADAGGPGAAGADVGESGAVGADAGGRRGTRDDVTRFRLATDEEPEAWLTATVTELPGSDETVAIVGQDVTDLARRARDHESFAANFEQLHHATTRLWAAETVEECLDIGVAAAVSILGFDWCAFVEARQDCGRFVVRAVSEDAPMALGDRPRALDEGIVGRVYRTGESEVTDDVYEHPETDDPGEFDPSLPDELAAVRSTLTVPVGEWGVFQALSTERGAFTDDDRRLLEALIAATATAIDRIDRESQLRAQRADIQRQYERIESLHTVATEMKTLTDRQSIYEAVVAASEEILEFDIALLDEVQGGVLVPVAVSASLSEEDYHAETPIDLEHSIGARCFREGQTYLVEDVREVDFAESRSKYVAILSVPLEGIGIFQAGSDRPGAFDETDRRLAELLVQHAEAAIERIERERELEQRAAELERQNERLDQFASILSHDMRTPLSVASGYLEIVREESDSPAVAEVAGALEELDDMVEDVLALAREGQEDLELERVDVADRARGSWGAMAPGAATLHVEEDLEIQADERRLGRLLENLFRNAFEHVGEDVTVTIGSLEDGFYVADDGPGIPEGEREAVLQPGETGDGDGTGLGLAIVADIAGVHGWNLDVTEDESGGCRFEFRGVERATE